MAGRALTLSGTSHGRSSAPSFPPAHRTKETVALIFADDDARGFVDRKMEEAPAPCRRGQEQALAVQWRIRRSVRLVHRLADGPHRLGRGKKRVGGVEGPAVRDHRQGGFLVLGLPGAIGIEARFPNGIERQRSRADGHPEGLAPVQVIEVLGSFVGCQCQPGRRAGVFDRGNERERVGVDHQEPRLVRLDREEGGRRYWCSAR